MNSSFQNNYLVNKNKELENIFLNALKNSILSGDLNGFLALHRSDNTFFLLEQCRWFTAISNSNDTNKTKYKITKFNIIDVDNRRVLSVTISIIIDETMKKELVGFYDLEIFKNRLFIKFHSSLDKSLESKNNKQIFYNSSLNLEAKIVSDFLEEIIIFFRKSLKFEFNSIDINIYLFNSLDSISFTIPEHSAYGWYESKESIKIFVPDYIEHRDIFLKKVLLHEMTHLFLVQISNDNLSLYFHEGFAMFIETYLCEKTHKLKFSNNRLKKQVINSMTILDHLECDLKSFEAINNLKEDNGIEIYHQGFLFTYFIINKYSLNYFLKFISSLSAFDYHESATSQKFKLLSSLTSSKFNVYFPRELRSTKDFSAFCNSFLH
ncbi:hypothetical protein [Exiguobacterium acetylicum]|uniref:hypothetical protein n=1 Tax=Exiguobacterium acetylicum TaxID=41170 RepID=UPI001CA66BE2|nr:hypothetical protein [Exiguobacterium acetylicum]QZY88528.1 hypothetical protein K7G97_17070 [Exiguobacterium acetylicum]